jgi:predicted ester cyclase
MSPPTNFIQHPSGNRKVFPDSVSDMDIISGRDRRAFQHFGNLMFRSLVSRSLHHYNNTERASKSAIVEGLYFFVARKGMRFMKSEDGGASYTPMSKMRAREKVAHAIRDQVNVASKRSSTTNSFEMDELTRELLVEWSKELDRLVAKLPHLARGRMLGLLEQEGLSVSEMDIIFSSRSNPVIQNKGNILLRCLVSRSIQHYSNETFRKLVEGLYQFVVRKRMRFVELKGESYLLMNEISAKEKVAQSVRDHVFHRTKPTMHYGYNDETHAYLDEWSRELYVLVTPPTNKSSLPSRTNQNTATVTPEEAPMIATVTTERTTVAQNQSPTSAPALKVGSFTGCSRSDAIGIMDALRRAVEAKSVESPPILIVVEKWLSGQGRGRVQRIEADQVIRTA